MANLSAASLASQMSELEDLVQRFKSGVEVRDRKYRLSTYKKCFVGTDAVQWLLNNNCASTVADAVHLGQIMNDQGVFEHVLREHPFKNEMLYYKFISEKERGAAKKKANGVPISWSDFLTTTSTNALDSLQPRVPAPDFEAVPPESVHVATQISPMDQYNVKFLDNAHPPKWVNPEYPDVYNLVVIGAGAGGLITSAGAAGLGGKVALVTDGFCGGDCLTYGCVPSKALIACATQAHAIKDSKALKEMGISVGDVKVDFGQVMGRMRKIRSEISDIDSATRFSSKLGVDVYFGYAKFVSDRAIRVNGKDLEFRKCVIATGGYPSLPPIPGLKELAEQAEKIQDGKPKPCIMTNESFFNLTTMPKRFGVIGTGVIGMEIAQAMQRLGARATMFGRSGKVLPKEDGDLADVIKTTMEEDGVKFRLSVSKYVSVGLSGEVSDNGYPEIVMKTTEAGKSETYYFDGLLVAAGRKPNVTGMQLEKAGVDYDAKQGLIINDFLQTTNTRIYGVGDCCSKYKFTHAADAMARMVIRNALFFGKEKMSSLLIPWATYTEPELAHVGLYESDLKEKGIAYQTYEKHFSDNDRAICEGGESLKGMVRIHTEQKSDRIVGASICGVNAGNLISEITLAMSTGIGLGRIASVIHPYPTTAEAIKQCGDLYNRTRLTPTVKTLLRGLMKIQR
eukprot:Plantae.Rhodophyta-Hildenbrandia_rubra.ctg2864.p1 GENE.Plantae.Rhodophyta-Hildenbrandia_rubra.ctg2864~~Plantae.Rhodophyta-Hildenbrandia_rubra.ctg2864.p1  ORF type:complete len:680 (-),score=129.13 Plantae.Rhodophyta-Hildenbrandia_rubra.ctg2864:2099-4138(-)